MDFFDSKVIYEWMQKCPTTCNIEFSEEFDRFCLFIREEGESMEDFMENFDV